MSRETAHQCVRAMQAAIRDSRGDRRGGAQLTQRDYVLSRESLESSGGLIPCGLGVMEELRRGGIEEVCRDIESRGTIGARRIA